MNRTLANPALLEIITPDGVCTGGSQEWYPDGWQRMSGCGPTAASNIMWYIACSRTELGGLCEVGNGDLDSFVALQVEMFGFITPGRGGVNTSKIFSEGAVKFGEKHGVALTPHVLEIPKLFTCRPSFDEAASFVLEALGQDAPVAFLNLSNGNQSQLDSWHWVTIVAFDPETSVVHISDDAGTLDVDLSEWLKTTVLGGALVYLTA